MKQLDEVATCLLATIIWCSPAMQLWRVRVAGLKVVDMLICRDWWHSPVTLLPGG